MTTGFEDVVDDEITDTQALLAIAMHEGDISELEAMAYLEYEAAEAEDVQQDFQLSLNRRAPSLSMGPGLWRRKRYFGRRSSYARSEENSVLMSSGEYYACFRFDRKHIPELVNAGL